MNDSIRIITTGGTIDSLEYKSGEKSVFSKSFIPQMLQHARLSVVVELEPLMLKDSADITEEDRKLVYERCIASKEDRIVITHGTDTMVETARFLGGKGIAQKVVVLTGSFIPFSQPDSDALFNLGYAIAAAQTLPAGVWAALNGEVFPWSGFRKNKEVGRFERLLM